MKIFKVGLVGVTGYTGMELARLLASHPRMKLEMACSRTESGLRLGEFYPFLEGLPGSDVVISIFDAKEAARRCDLVFLAVPHGKAMEMAGELLEAGTRVIDLSADFRLRDVNVYEDWYVPHTRRELLPEAVYGLPELYAAETAKHTEDRADVARGPPGGQPRLLSLVGHPGPVRSLQAWPDLAGQHRHRLQVRHLRRGPQARGALPVLRSLRHLPRLRSGQAPPYPRDRAGIQPRRRLRRARLLQPASGAHGARHPVHHLHHSAQARHHPGRSPRRLHRHRSCG